MSLGKGSQIITLGRLIMGENSFAVPAEDSEFGTSMAWNERYGSGKLFFLEGIGVTPIKARHYDELYGEVTWRR
jgi:hypothetical protein